METADLISVYPRRYHTAEAGSWDDIKENGLLSTSALFDDAGIWGADHDAIESQRRAVPVTVRVSLRELLG